MAVNRSRLTSSLTRRPNFLLGFHLQDAALADVLHRPRAGVLGEQRHVAETITAEHQQLAAWLLLRAVLRPRNTSHICHFFQDGMPELVLQRLPAHQRGSASEFLFSGGVPFVEQAAQRHCACAPAGPRAGSLSAQVADHPAAGRNRRAWFKADVLPTQMKMISTTDGNHDPREVATGSRRRPSPAGSGRQTRRRSYG